MAGDTDVMTHSTGNDPWPIQLVRSLSAVAADVAVVLGLVVLANVAALADVGGVPRVALGLVLLFVLPGYALSIVLYPGRATGRLPISDGLEPAERLAVGFGLSVALLPGFGLVLAAAGIPYSTSTVVGAVSAFVVTALFVGVARAATIPPSDQYRAPVQAWGGVVYRRLFRSGPVDGMVNLVLVIAMVLAVSGLAYAVAAPADGESYTGFSLLTTDADGELVADDYPTELTAGDSEELTVAIDNQEGEAIEYTVVVELQTVETSDVAVEPTDREELHRTTLTVGAGETEYWHHDVTPTMTGEGLRLVYHLYIGEAPETPSTDTDYRTVYIWVDVDG